MTDYAAFLNALVIASGICARFYSKRRNKRAVPPPPPPVTQIALDTSIRRLASASATQPPTLARTNTRARRKVSAMLPRRSGRFMARAHVVKRWECWRRSHDSAQNWRYIALLRSHSSALGNNATHERPLVRLARICRVSPI
jgi:hypothetical protein